MSSLKNPPTHTRRSALIQLALTSLAGACPSASPAKAQPFVTDFGVCAAITDFPIYKEAGYNYLEANTRRFLQPEEPDEKVAAALAQVREEGTRIHACNGFLPPTLKSSGKQPNHEGILAYAEVAFRRAQSIGVKGIVYGSSQSRKLPPNFERAKGEAQFVALLKKMAPLAQKYQLELWLEPLNRGEDNFLNTQQQGAVIIDKVGHPALGLTCDLFHVAKNGESPEDIKKYIHYMRHCHVAEKERRTPPGTAGYNFKPYLLALQDGNYRGSMSIECRWKDIPKQAAPALQNIKKQIKDISLT